jgi:hypothetical protein
MPAALGIEDKLYRRPRDVPRSGWEGPCIEQRVLTVGQDAL